MFMFKWTLYHSSWADCFLITLAVRTSTLSVQSSLRCACSDGLKSFQSELLDCETQRYSSHVRNREVEGSYLGLSHQFPVSEGIN
jgi:hypothetical protein